MPTWEVDRIQQNYPDETVTAYELVIEDGQLVFKDQEEEVVKAFARGSWTAVKRVGT